MCGFYTGASLAQIKSAFKIDQFLIQNLRADLNYTPGKEVPVLTKLNGASVLQSMRFGLIPDWAEDPSIGQRMFNARAETLSEKPSFRSAYKSRRCLIPAAGFYEWAKQDQKRQPYYFTLKDRAVFAMAGLFNSWKDPEGDLISSYTIITTEPNQLIQPVHNRMPVILTKPMEDLWLKAGDQLSNAQLIFQPFPVEQMQMQPLDPKRSEL